MLPEFVTHYHLPDRQPFLNLSELDDADVAVIDREMAELRRQGLQLRPFGRRYIEWRRLTEARLRSLFVARGGKPERNAPHYFVLGESPWFERLAVDMRSVRLPLAALPIDATSMTLPDSFTAMEFGERFGHPTDPKPYHGRAFLLSELDELISTYGMPTPVWDDSHMNWREWPASAYIEIQLWSDAPVRKYLSVDAAS